MVSTTGTRELYDQIVAHGKQISYLSSIMSVAQWDKEVMMPQNEGAVAARGKALSALGGVMHEKSTSKEYSEMLDKIQQQDLSELNEMERANLKLVLYTYEKNKKLPVELVMRMSELTTLSESKWAEAREAKDYSMFSPSLTEILELLREFGKHLDSTKRPYDLALDEFERGITMDRLNEVFDELKASLLPLIHRVRAAKQIDDKWLKDMRFDVKKQEELGKKIAAAIGFDFKRGRLDTSVHPFSTSFAIDDGRITTRYSEDNLIESVYSTIHESGHAMYEQGLNHEYADTKVGGSSTMGVHESQSLFWELMIARSPEFCSWVWPMVKETFPDIPAHVDANEFYRVINVSRSSFIRVNADELTYPLHIILRWELEQQLLDGSLSVADLPQAWNAKMKEYLDIVPEDDAQGCLQDVHWSGAALGYFPSYLLGETLSAQWLAHMKRSDLPNLSELVAKGDFAPIREWLNKNIHQHGCRFETADNLVKHVTGEPINPKYLIQHLTEKYTRLYNL
ncbi:hypothetical protein RI367_001297 [Sorochytrium milnesiophthora]